MMDNLGFQRSCSHNRYDMSGYRFPDRHIPVHCLHPLYRLYGIQTAAEELQELPILRQILRLRKREIMFVSLSQRQTGKIPQ